MFSFLLFIYLFIFLSLSLCLSLSLWYVLSCQHLSLPFPPSSLSVRFPGSWKFQTLVFCKVCFGFSILFCCCLYGFTCFILCFRVFCGYVRRCQCHAWSMSHCCWFQVQSDIGEGTTHHFSIHSCSRWPLPIKDPWTFIFFERLYMYLSQCRGSWVWFTSPQVAISSECAIKVSRLDAPYEPSLDRTFDHCSFTILRDFPLHKHMHMMAFTTFAGCPRCPARRAGTAVYFCVSYSYHIHHSSWCRGWSFFLSFWS